jgi:hypothetical protein
MLKVNEITHMKALKMLNVNYRCFNDFILFKNQKLTEFDVFTSLKVDGNEK